MFLPLRDAPNPPGVPFVNYGLLALNVLVFVLLQVPLAGAAPHVSSAAIVQSLQALGFDNVSAFDVFTYQFGYRPVDGSALTLFTSMFMHGDWMHLAGNMLFLWIFGNNVEARLGHVWYLLAYLATGAVATLSHALLDLSSEIPMVGASGAISGALGFYFVFFPKNVVYVFVFLFPIMMNVIAIPARIVLGAYLVLSNLLPLLFTMHQEGGGVAHAAHIGGFISGVGIAYLVGSRGAGRVPVPGRQRTGSLMHPDSRLPAETSIGVLVGRGRVDEAAALYFERPKGSVNIAPQDGLEIGRWLADNDNPEAALVVFKELLARYPDGETGAWAHLGAGYVQVNFLGRTTAGYQHLLEAIEADPSGDAAQRARAALAAIDGQ